jgi:hypothetical protein
MAAGWRRERLWVSWSTGGWWALADVGSGSPDLLRAIGLVAV